MIELQQEVTLSLLARRPLPNIPGGEPPKPSPVQKQISTSRTFWCTNKTTTNYVIDKNVLQKTSIAGKTWEINGRKNGGFKAELNLVDTCDLGNATDREIKISVNNKGVIQKVEYGPDSFFESITYKKPELTEELFADLFKYADNKDARGK